MEALPSLQPCSSLVPAISTSLINTHRARPGTFSINAGGRANKVGGAVLRQSRRAEARRRRYTSIVRAASTSSPDNDDNQIAPLEMKSPVGQLLSQILTTHPHLLPATVEQQLDQLQTDRDAEQLEDTPSTSSTDITLYRRIAEVKANERSKALEEILYALVVQRFVNGGVSLIPSISQPPDNSQRVDSWPVVEEAEIARFHSNEAYEMIENHLALILGHRVNDSVTIAEISKLRVGQVYVASVMFGYFLRRVDHRFQLEKSMKTLPFGLDEEAEVTSSHRNDNIENDDFNFSNNPGGFGYGVKATRLRSYVMSIDSDTLQKYTTVRSKEAASIIEKQTEALFGRPEIIYSPQGKVESSTDEVLKIGFFGLKRIVLEAVTFGSFLWDVESYVDSRYQFV